MRRKKVRLLIASLLLGYGFWLFNPANNGLYMEQGFVLGSDCEATRAWVQGVLPSPAPAPSPSPIPTPAGMRVGPGCVLLNPN